MSKSPSSATVITAWAPAKINLGLRVLGKRADGYHDLLSLMVPVSLWDELRFESHSRGLEVLCPSSHLPSGKENLVYRAAQLLMDTCDRHEGVKIELTKNIPVAAGLGGGSSDAAITLLVVNELFGRPLDHEELHRLAGRLGADVPFFLACRPAMAEGIGDRLTPLNILPTLWTVLLHAKFEVSTKWAYENLTLTTETNGSKFYSFENIGSEEVDAYRQRLLGRQQLTSREVVPLLVNDFEPLVFGRYPQLIELKRTLLSAGARTVTMTGSGPTLVGLFDSEKKALTAYDVLCRADDCTTFLAHTLDTMRPFVVTA